MCVFFCSMCVNNAEREKEGKKGERNKERDGSALLERSRYWFRVICVPCVYLSVHVCVLHLISSR